MEFVIGFGGAVVAMILMIAGVVFGWKSRECAYERETRATAEQLTEVEKRRLREEAEAWMALHNYSADDAYGMNREPAREKE